MCPACVSFWEAWKWWSSCASSTDAAAFFLFSNRGDGHVPPLRSAIRLLWETRLWLFTNHLHRAVWKERLHLWLRLWLGRQANCKLSLQNAVPCLLGAASPPPDILFLIIQINASELRIKSFTDVLWLTWAWHSQMSWHCVQGVLAVPGSFPKGQKAPSHLFEAALVGHSKLVFPLVAINMTRLNFL